MRDKRRRVQAGSGRFDERSFRDGFLGHENPRTAYSDIAGGEIENETEEGERVDPVRTIDAKAITTLNANCTAAHGDVIVLPILRCGCTRVPVRPRDTILFFRNRVSSRPRAPLADIYALSLSVSFFLPSYVTYFHKANSFSYGYL